MTSQTTAAHHLEITVTTTEEAAEEEEAAVTRTTVVGMIGTTHEVEVVAETGTGTVSALQTATTVVRLHRTPSRSASVVVSVRQSGTKSCQSTST
jgi:hypothetical protein